MRGMAMPAGFAGLLQRGSRAWRALLLGLALALPLVQLGMLQHAQRHHENDYSHQADQKHAAAECDVCLAFSHLGAAHTSVAHAPLLLSGLSFGLVLVQDSSLPRAGPRSLHNRGPPTAL